MRCLLAIFLFAGTAIAQTPPPQAPGYQLVFSDSFDTLSLSPDGYGNYTWYPAIPWKPEIPPASRMRAAHSVLTLMCDRDDRLNDSTISTVARDLSHYHAYRYGYFEARMSWEPSVGSWPAFWMGPIQLLKDEPIAGEIDIFEGQGSDPNIFYGTAHVWIEHGTKQTFDQGCACKLPKSNQFSAWHTYGLLWTPGKMTWYYDNVALYSVIVPDIFERQDYFLMLGSQKGVDWTYGNLKGVTAHSMALNVDWVRVWQTPPSVNR